MIDPVTAAAWVERWERQQECYAQHREARFAAAIDLVERAVSAHERPVVLDLGAGPGSFAARLASALPRVHVLAIESDAFLVALGRAWCGEVVDFVHGIAGSPGWRAHVGERDVHAVVASSALHYPPVSRLGELYVELLDWLADDGILVNVDHFADLVDATGGDPPPTDIGPWMTWWEDVAHARELAGIYQLRTHQEGVDGDNGLTTSDHLKLLRMAGFARTVVAWQRDRSGIVVAQR